MSFLRPRRLIGVVAVGACALAGVAATSGTSEAVPNGPTLDIQLLSFNDFHGNLEAPSGSSGTLPVDHTLGKDKDGKTIAVDVTKQVGGVEYLATHLAQARQGHPYSLTVAAGDLIGASPLLSAAFHDEPTIEAMNALKLDASAVGNHEFDEGYKELQRMQNGGCIDDGAGTNNQDSCALHTFGGADFQYLAANVKYAGTDTTILPAYTVKNIKGAKIGFIGMTLRDTPSIVTASGVAGLQFTDEVKTANALVPVLRKQGVNAIVVLIHQGGTPDQQTWIGPDGQPYRVNPTYDYTCGKGGSLKADSPIIPIAQNLDPAIDMVISGHTHQPYVCDIKDKAGQDRLVTSASSFGRLFTETNLTYDRRTQDIVRASVSGSNMLVTRDVPKDAAQTKIIADYSTAIAPIASKVIGRITTDVKKSVTNPAGESALGDLIADAQLADPSVVTGGQTPVLAFMNPGGIRADLTYAQTKYPNEQPGDVTYEEAFTVQPFNNYLVSMTLTGKDIYALLTQQVTGPNASAKKTLQVSKGFTYEMTPAGPVPGSVKLGGVAIDEAASYRIVTNNFLSDGGDNFPAFTNGTGKYFGGLDIDAFASHLQSVSPYTPAPLNRITGSVS
jgi:2',3'-cyclic-nucleotide 2'-phosphodiesterase (5'-nucleotidase family)